MGTTQVSILFYYVLVSSFKIGDSKAEFSWSTFLVEFRQMLEELKSLDLSERKENFSKDEKVVWLDDCPKITESEIDIVIKSAKYNHVRDVIDTSNMTNRGRLKKRNDGDEEKTHLCLRYHEQNEQMICLFGKNYYGTSIGKVMTYLSNRMKEWSEKNQKSISYSFGTQIMPGKEFIEELKRMKNISLVTVTINSSEFQDDFLHLAGRDETKKTVDIQIKKAKRTSNIPVNLVENYYQDWKKSQKIKKIKVEGKNDNGSIKIDTESIQLKQSINVMISDETREILSESFFIEAQATLESLMGKAL